MGSELTEWMYLKTMVGNFPQLIEYFFRILYPYGAAFRQAGFGLIFSLGLAWTAINLFKAPFDRMKSAAVGLGMVMLAGFLNSPTTSTKGLGDASGAELSIGGYYSYVIASTVTGVFSSVVEAAWHSTVFEAGGGGPGMAYNSLAIAWGSQADKFASQFINAEGKEAYVDYQMKCGTDALLQAKTGQDKALLAKVGIGANTLGMRGEEAGELAQYHNKIKAGETTWLDNISMPSMNHTRRYDVEVAKHDTEREKAVNFLKEGLIEANNRIDGTKGYRIPTREFYQEIVSGEEGGRSNSYTSISESPAEFREMLPVGLTSATPGSEEDFAFYPKNCYELYLVADRTMANFRSAVRNNPEHLKLNYANAYNSMTASGMVRKAVMDEAVAKARELGYEGDFSISMSESASDVGMDFFKSISNKFNKWMLEFKIPALAAAMALLVVVLLVSFPIFAIFSILVGPKILFTYFKLMLLPFLVIFLNDLFLTMSTNLIAYGKVSKELVNTFFPNGADVASAVADQNIQAIIFGVLTFAELAIVKFLLWDDFRAVTSFNPGEATTNAAASGAKVASAAAAVPLGAAGGAARMAAASANRGRAVQQTALLASISKSVSNMGSMTRTRKQVSPRSSGSGLSRPAPTNAPRGPSGSQSPPLVPPKS